MLSEQGPKDGSSLFECMLWANKVKTFTCLFVSCEIDGAIATATKLLLKEVLIFDVSLARLDEPGTVQFHVLSHCVYHASSYSQS